MQALNSLFFPRKYRPAKSDEKGFARIKPRDLQTKAMLQGLVRQTVQRHAFACSRSAGLIRVGSLSCADTKLKLCARSFVTFPSSRFSILCGQCGLRFVHAYVSTCMHTCMHKYPYSCMCTCTCVRVFMRAPARAHTRTKRVCTYTYETCVIKHAGAPQKGWECRI